MFQGNASNVPGEAQDASMSLEEADLMMTSRLGHRILYHNLSAEEKKCKDEACSLLRKHEKQLASHLISYIGEVFPYSLTWKQVLEEGIYFSSSWDYQTTYLLEETHRMLGSLRI